MEAESAKRRQAGAEVMWGEMKASDDGKGVYRIAPRRKLCEISKSNFLGHWNRAARSGCRG